jgi:hypothetical protein
MLLWRWRRRDWLNRLSWRLLENRRFRTNWWGWGDYIRSRCTAPGSNSDPQFEHRSVDLPLEEGSGTECPHSPQNFAFGSNGLLQFSQFIFYSFV